MSSAVFPYSQCYDTFRGLGTYWSIFSFASSTAMWKMSCSNGTFFWTEKCWSRAWMAAWCWLRFSTNGIVSVTDKCLIHIDKCLGSLGLEDAVTLLFVELDWLFLKLRRSNQKMFPPLLSLYYSVCVTMWIKLSETWDI